jgi:hypothetical protein
MKKAAFLTIWIVAIAITCTVAQPGDGTTGTGKRTIETVSTATGNGSDTTRMHKTKHTKRAMRMANTNKTDSVITKKGKATLPDGTDAKGSGNNGTGGNGTGNGGNGGVGTGRRSGN